MRFATFSEDWIRCTLEEVSFSLDYGVGASAINFDGLNKYIRITDIDDNGKFNQKNLTSPSFFSNEYIVKEKDILFARTGASVGKTYKYNTDDGKLYYAGFLINAHIKNCDDVNLIYNITKSKKYLNWVNVMSRRSGQPGINSKEYGSFSFYLPFSRKEKIKVSNLLELLDNQIQIQIKIIEDKYTQMNYIIKYIFDNSKEYKPLESLYSYGKAGGTPKSTNREYYGGEIPFLSIADITQQGKYIFHTTKTITDIGLKNSSTWLVPKNSLILSMYASVGLPAINKMSLATSQAMFSMILKDNEDLDFLFYYLTYYQKYRMKSSLETGTQSNINADTIRKIPIPIYKNEDKIKISKILSTIDKSISVEKKIIEKLIYQKSYLLNNLFI